MCRMIQRGDSLSLALKAFAERFEALLDGDGAIQARIARHPHFTHAALPQRPNDLVGAQFIAHGERHDWKLF